MSELDYVEVRRGDLELVLRLLTVWVPHGTRLDPDLLARLSAASTAKPHFCNPTLARVAYNARRRRLRRRAS